MIRYYDGGASPLRILIYENHSRSHRLYNVEIIYFDYSTKTFQNRKDVDISKMYASASEDLYNMLKSDDKEMVNMAFDFIFGQLGKEK
jgi:hypothetical protein